MPLQLLPSFIKQPEDVHRQHAASSRQDRKEVKNWSVQRKEVKLSKIQQWHERKNPR